MTPIVSATSTGRSLPSNSIEPDDVVRTPPSTGSRIRLRLTIKSVEPVEGGVRTTSSGTMELEGSDRPVLVAETIGVTYD